MAANVDQATGRPRTFTGWLLLGGIVLIIAVSLLVEIWFIPGAIARVTDTFPETRIFQTYGLVWTLLVFSAWQVLLVLALVAELRHRRGRSMQTTMRWIACLLVGIVLLAAAALVALTVLAFATPAVMLGLVAMAVVAIAGALAILLLGYAR